MKKALLIIAVIAAIVTAFAAGRLEGIHHVTRDATAWVEYDGYVVLEIDGSEYRFEAF